MFIYIKMSTDIYNSAYATLNTFAVLSAGTFTGEATNGNDITISGGSYGSGTNTYDNINTVSGSQGSQANIATALTELDTFISAVAAATPSAVPSIPLVAGTNNNFSFLPNVNYVNPAGSGVTFTGSLTFTGNATDQFFISVSGGHSLNFTNVTGYTLSGGAKAQNIFWRNTISGAGGIITFQSANGIPNPEIPGIVMFIGTGGTSSNGIQMPFPSAFLGRFYTQSGPINFSQTAYTGSLGSSLDGNLNDVVCYAKGTLILTNKGLVPIENIEAGDQVITKGKIHNAKFVKDHATLKTEPVTWISKFKVTNPTSKSRPICITKDALGKNSPFKDLYVSPGHRLLLNSKMVSAKKLVNETTIYQDSECDSVEYYHLECKHHRAVFANGILAESYLDKNNRGAFENRVSLPRKVEGAKK